MFAVGNRFDRKLYSSRWGIKCSKQNAKVTGNFTFVVASVDRYGFLPSSIPFRSFKHFLPRLFFPCQRGANEKAFQWLDFFVRTKQDKISWPHGRSQAWQNWADIASRYFRCLAFTGDRPFTTTKTIMKQNRHLFLFCISTKP